MKVSLSELLGIKVTSVPAGRRRSILKSNFSEFNADDFMLTEETTPPALSDTEALTTFLSDVLRPIKEDPYGSLLLVRIDCDSEPSFFLLELKSPDVWRTMMEKMKRHTSTGIKRNISRVRL